jgi:anhydro-N-acetylmuramic acid kinase
VQHFYPGETFDCDGGHARTGSVIPRLLDEWMAIPYVAAPPPKSTGRELFGVRFVKNAIQANRDEKPEDLIATAAEFTARSLAENLALHVAPQWQIGRLLLAGGGARNGFLVGRIRGELRNIPGGEGIRRGTIEEEGMESKARECVAFAVLGYARLCGIPANVPSATGARHPALLGKLVEPPPNRS